MIGPLFCQIGINRDGALHLCHIHGCWSLRANLNSKFHSLTFSERFEALHLNSGMVNKNIATALITRNKAIALLIIEPLHRAGLLLTHLVTSLVLIKTCIARRIKPLGITPMPTLIQPMDG